MSERHAKLEQPVVSEKVVAVPIVRDGVVERYRAMRIRILGLSEIARISLFGSAVELTPIQIDRINARKQRLEERCQ